MESEPDHGENCDSWEEEYVRVDPEISPRTRMAMANAIAHPSFPRRAAEAEAAYPSRPTRSAEIMAVAPPLEILRIAEAEVAELERECEAFTEEDVEDMAWHVVSASTPPRSERAHRQLELTKMPDLCPNSRGAGEFLNICSSATVQEPAVLIARELARISPPAGASSSTTADGPSAAPSPVEMDTSEDTTEEQIELLARRRGDTREHELLQRVQATRTSTVTSSAPSGAQTAATRSAEVMAAAPPHDILRVAEAAIAEIQQTVTVKAPPQTPPNPRAMMPIRGKAPAMMPIRFKAPPNTMPDPTAATPVRRKAPPQTPPR